MIPIFKPILKKEELKAAEISLKEGWLGMGKYVKLFEKEILKIIKNKKKHVVAVNTGFSAIHLSCILINLKKGDEVITPAFTNIADLQSILLTGARPVFCDISEKDYCIDPKKIEKLITKKTKAIIPIDYGCSLANHDEINYIANKHSLRVIHDAAHSIGSFYKNKAIGSFSDLAIFSFDPVKSFTCIDGGAVVVNSNKEKEILHELRLMGMTQKSKILYKNQRSTSYDVNRIGYRYHLANLHAAIGLSQLKKIKLIKSRKQKNYKIYTSLLCHQKNVITPKLIHKNIIPFHYCVRVKNRSKLMDYLKKRGIESGIHWMPNNYHTLFKNIRQDDLKITKKISGEILSLPFFPEITKNEIKYICKEISNFYNKNN